MMTFRRQSQQYSQPGQIWPVFTNNKVNKHDVCPQGTCETWRRLERLIKETAANYFISYFMGRYRRAG